MISASSLLRNCGHPRVLSELPPKDAAARKRRGNREAGADRGRAFHSVIETWARDGVPPAVSEDSSIFGWPELLAQKWAPPPGIKLELAWGLLEDGRHAEVDEKPPGSHIYVARDGSPLLTAGRSDASWVGYDGRLYGLDWKAGKWPVTEPARNLQINAACIALMDLTAAPSYVPGIYYARDGVFEWGEPVELGSPEYRSILAEVVTAARLDDMPRTGEWCGRCWDRRECKAYKELTP